MQSFLKTIEINFKDKVINKNIVFKQSIYISRKFYVTQIVEKMLFLQNKFTLTSLYNSVTKNVFKEKPWACFSLSGN